MYIHVFIFTHHWYVFFGGYAWRSLLDSGSGVLGFWFVGRWGINKKVLRHVVSPYIYIYACMYHGYFGGYA